MSVRPIILASFFAILMTNLASAQDTNDRVEELQTALRQNQTDLALELATALYETSDDENDHTTAGFSSYVVAGLLEQKTEFVDAARAYEDCSDHYNTSNSHAQSIQCQYKSGLAYLAGAQHGRAIDALKSAGNSLEELGQERSALASQVYLTLSTEIRPPKLDRGRGANRLRLSSVAYADKSLAALAATGQNGTENHALALYTKGLALEDAESFEESSQIYAEAVDIYSNVPDHSDEVLRNMQSRLSIAKFGATDETEQDTLDVHDNKGRIITLEIDQTKDVRTPRIHGNQMVDGARVRAKITLADEGSVEQIDILESTPSDDFGEAFEKAVKEWIFTPPDGVSSEDIPPFEYSMIFYVQRR
jgi:TonB family protein